MPLERVLLGMSGGVDSSSAAFLLKEQGYEVVGITLCLCPDDYNSALEVANALGIEHHFADFRSEFKREVIEPFIDEYFSGRTPNPCIVCNSKIKFGLMSGLMERYSCSKLATGHYAKIVKKDNAYHLCKSKNLKKDQSYFLYAIPKEVLSSVIFPLSDYDKIEVRNVAEKAGIPVYERPESQEICFVPEDDFVKFMRGSGRKSKTGNIIDKNGEILAPHKGIECYTIGQRRGLGVALGHRVFVTDIDFEKHTITLSEEEDLWKDTVEVGCARFLENCSGDFFAQGKIRHSHEAYPCEVRKKSEDEFLVKFISPVRALAPGQSLVLYDGDMVLGGGVIKSSGFALR